MKSSNGSDSLSDIALAKNIQDNLDQSPLLVDILNEVRTHRSLGISDDKIQTILESTFDVTTDEDYTSTRDEDKEIIVTNLPEKYNQLDWR